MSSASIEILVNVSPGEVRAALRADGQCVELVVERPHSGPAVGDVYVARVRKLSPGGEFAFVDIGEERDAFLKLVGSRSAHADDKRSRLVPDSLILVRVNRPPAGAKGARVAIARPAPPKERAHRWEGSSPEGKPRRIYREGDALARLVARLPFATSQQVVVDDPASLESLRRLLPTAKGAAGPRIELYQGDSSLFAHFGIESEIERALARTVHLDGGGTLIFDRTEALTVIDVNSGRAAGSPARAGAALGVNLEAARAIARHLRLRNLGGIVVIDFISMASLVERERVVQELRSALTGDRARIEVGKMSEFGLVEMTRERLGQGLAEVLTGDCAACDGSGRPLSIETAATSLLRRLDWEARRHPSAKRLEVEAPAALAEHLAAHWSEEVRTIEQTRNVAIVVLPVAGDRAPTLLAVLGAGGSLAH